MRMIRKLYDNEDDMRPIQTRFSLITMTRKVAETMGEELIWTLSGLCWCWRWWRSLLPPPPVLLLPSLSLLLPPDHLLQSSLLLLLSLNLSPSAFILLSESSGFLGKVDHFLWFSAECSFESVCSCDTDADSLSYWDFLYPQSLTCSHIPPWCNFAIIGVPLGHFRPGFSRGAP